MKVSIQCGMHTNYAYTHIQHILTIRPYRRKSEKQNRILYIFHINPLLWLLLLLFNDTHTHNIVSYKFLRYMEYQLN